MLTCYPQLLQNFIYNSVSLLDIVRKPSAFFKMMVARDLVISEAICRHFWWHTLMLWPDELPEGTVVSLAVDDELVPCSLVQRHLEESLRWPDPSLPASMSARGSSCERERDPSAALAGLESREWLQNEAASTQRARACVAADDGPDGSGGGGAVHSVRVFVSPGAHGAFIAKPELQHELVSAWKLTIEGTADAGSCPAA
jgi:hypothetical protein